MVTKMCNAKHKFERLALTKEELLEMFDVQPSRRLSYKVRYRMVV